MCTEVGDMQRGVALDMCGSVGASSLRLGELDSRRNGGMLAYALPAPC